MSEEGQRGQENAEWNEIEERNRSGSNPSRAAVTPVNLFKGEREITKEAQCKASEELLLWSV